MQDDGYISQLSGSNSTKTQQNSTVLNFNSTKLSEWAKLFIKNNQLTQSNLKNSSQFKNLNLKQKQAIYYQLRKKTPKINKFSKSSKTKEVEKTGFNLALLSMIPVFFSEYLILTFSYLFYVGLGFSFEVACISALCVEFFYMLSSSSDRVQLKILRWVIFAYSAFTVCFATYSNDSQFKNYRNLQTKTIFELESQLLQQKKISKSLLKRETGLLADMEVYRKNEMITLGRSRLAGEKAQIHSAMSQNQNKTESLISKINLEKKSQLSRGAFSIDNLKLIEVKTWSVMAFLILIQLLSSICTNEFFKALRLRPKNKSKRRTHKKKRRDDHGGIAKSKLNLH
jgi:hypothetical protein